MKRHIKLNFVTLFLHVLVTSLIFITKYQNIEKANFQSNESKLNASKYINIFLILSLIMLTIQLILTLIGLPFERRLINWQILFQILGLISYSWYIIMQMPYKVISYMWVFCFLPFIIKIISRIASNIIDRKFSAIDL